MQISEKTKKFLSYKGVPEFTALTGAVLYLLLSLRFAHIQPTILDEGTYLVKGFLFTNGRYSPFQAYGPWTNHMPFSYLIPGWIEQIFEPGLRTGRYFSVFLGLLMLLGLWLLGGRLGNRWLAVGLVWIIALNPVMIRVYSLAVSQVLMACILTWILVLTLDNPNKLWQLLLASALASLMVITRINMAPVLPFLLFFIFWQFGWRSGLFASLAGLLTLVVSHTPFWPGILQMWARWIPKSISPFLDTWRTVNTGSGTWKPVITAGDRISSLLDGLRFNFIPVLVLIGFGILVIQRKRWKNLFHYRAAVFLTILSGFMILVHGWASLSNNYCVYCFSGYLMFFSPLMLLLLVLTAVSWEPGPGKWYTVFVVSLVIGLTTLVGWGAFQEIGSDLVEFPVPLFLTGTFRPGSIPLWGVLENGFNIPFMTSRWLVPIVLGFLSGIIILTGVFISFRKLKDKQSNYHFGIYSIITLIIIGIIFSPTPILSADGEQVSCQEDILSSIEEAGRYLDKTIPDGSLIYWAGSDSAVPLLYINHAEIFPAQLNNGYSYRIGGDPDELLQFGLWNEELSERWKQEADYILIIESKYDQTWKQYLESGDYSELPRSPSINPCETENRLRIFKRISPQSKLTP